MIRSPDAGQKLLASGWRRHRSRARVAPLQSARAGRDRSRRGQTYRCPRGCRQSLNKQQNGRRPRPSGPRSLALLALAPHVNYDHGGCDHAPRLSETYQRQDGRAARTAASRTREVPGTPEPAGNRSYRSGHTRGMPALDAASTTQRVANSVLPVPHSQGYGRPASPVQDLAQLPLTKQTCPY